MELRLRLLGPVSLVRDGCPVAAGGPTQRAVLAMLAVRAGQPVRIGDLVAGIWGEADEPAGGGRSLWAHVSRLRSVLGNADKSITTVPGGYRLDPSTIAVDAREFEQLLATARRHRAAGDGPGAAAALDRALGLWAGPALMDLRDFPFAGPVVARLDELHAGAHEDRMAARLAIGEDADLVPELQALVAEHPYRERLHGQLMVALYRAGQQAAALDAYRVARGRLLLDLGVEPGPELERLHCEILRRADVLGPGLDEPLERPNRGGAPPVRRTLPAAPVLFGRDDQLADLERLASGARLLTLTGAGGSGKTALALALAHRLAARYLDGALVVDLGAVAEPEQLLPAIAGALGIAHGAETSDELVAAYLADHRVLLVLDSVEHLHHAARGLGKLTAASSGLTLATSRTPLGLIDEIVVDVPPLAVPQPGDGPQETRSRSSVQLFLHEALAAGGRVEPEAEIGHIGGLCAALDGLPLAIQIVASQTRAETPAELAANLDERLPRLASRRSDAPARQHTMDAAIGWSIDLLDADEQASLSLLACFASSFTARAASTVLDTGRERTIEILTALLDASLLTRSATIADQARFRMLQPVRAVARSRLGAGLMADANRRLAAFVAAEVDRLCPRGTGIRRETDLDLLRAEYPDVIATLGRLAADDPERCIELADQLEDFWQWTGREIEVGRLADGVLDGGRLSARATFLAVGMSGWGAFLRGQPDEMRHALDRMLELADELDDPAISALARLREARFGIMLGTGEHVRLAARAAVEHARRADAPRIFALALAARTLAEPDAPEADHWAQEAVDIATRGSMAYTLLWALGSKSILLDVTGRADEGMSIEREVLDLAGRFRALASAALAACNLAGSLVQRGRIAEARRIILPTLASADRAGHRIWAAVAVSEVAEVEAASGRWPQALTLLTASLATAERMDMLATWPPQDRVRLDRVVRWLAELLGERGASSAIARGRVMGYREMVDFALDLGRDPLAAAEGAGV